MSGQDSKFVVLKTPRVPKALVEEIQLALKETERSEDRRGSSIVDEKSNSEKALTGKAFSLTAGVGQRVSSNIPKFNPVDTFAVRRVYFVASNASAISCTRGSIGKSLGFICRTTNSSCTCVCTSFRLKSLTLYPSVVTSGISKAQVSWAAGTAEQALQKDEAPMALIPQGMTVPVALKFTPPKGVWASMWQTINQNDTDVLLSLSADAGSLVVLEAEATHAGSFGNLGFTGASVTAGQMYYYSLDTVSSGNIIQPQGLPFGV